MSAGTVSILEGSTFVVSDRRGDIDASPTETSGLFHMDTRFLSRWILTVDGQRPNLLSTDDLQYHSAQFFLVPATGTIYVDAALSIIRRRAVGGGFHEDLSVLNHSGEPKDLDVRVEVGCDFADLFEVKDALAKKGQGYRRVEDGRIVLGYRRDRFVRETWVVPSQGAQLSEDGVRFRVHLEPHGRWDATLDVVTAFDGFHRRERPKYADVAGKPQPEGTDLDEWIANAPRLLCSYTPLHRTYQRSIADLAGLRFYPKGMKGALPAAGLPWFMAVFGRDSVITSYQALPFEPELARTTLKLLAALQGTRVDDFRDEEPGKIIHELRWGEMTAFEERPQSPYFGGADTTALFLVLLDEYERFSGDAQLVRALEPQARAALSWIEDYGDRDKDGYVEYETRSPKTGLVNQCWKDSWNSILFSDGTLAKLPRATCEIQGYVYDARVRCAQLAREIWNDPGLASKLEEQASALKRRFNQDFWLADRGYFALALDGDKKQVDALSSNIGHLLWSGIVDKDKAQAVVDHLMGPRLYSGWGVRTMAEGDGGYNPIGYHVGTVWPHDCSITAWGLRRYGFAKEAARLAFSILEAAQFFDGRLPEAFAGHPRELTEFPVEYPTACSPQAWATGAPLLMLRALLGLEPVGDHLLVAPAVPRVIERLGLLGIPGRWGRADAFALGKIPIVAPGYASRPSMSAEEGAPAT
ncbi:MAG: amylo-alpha-1,6-glucosidase [Deltaproteobacteria bacterium]|nr:amylo-alpha-1,6-glucosidase [Deltaproteobacteria bacterium]